MAIIGRESPADIVIPQPQISPLHAEIRHLGADVYEITDRGSANGTFVNGYRIQKATVRLGDQVSLGGFVIDLRVYATLIPQNAQGQAPEALWSTPAPPPPYPDSGRPARSPAAGVWIALAIIGAFAFFFLAIVAAIAIPNLLNATQRTKGRRTMGDIRSVATACESYATDYNMYPAAKSMEELAQLISPVYIKMTPRTDAWGRPLRYEVWGEKLESYGVGSAGKDGVWEQGSLAEYLQGTTTSYNADIVFVDGQFVRYPEGVQR